MLADADIASRQYNPACGDRVSMTAKVVDGVLTNSKWQASGCVISVATASLLSEVIQNKTLDDIKKIDSDAILALIGMQLGPTRLKCALLPLYALQALR